MENLKFRAWHKKHEKYYDLLKIDWLDGFVLIDNEYDCSTADLDEVVIEQYTGLRDKDGKEIYIGDIVETINNIFVMQSDYSCLYHVEHQGFIGVIGNIHENVDLL